LEKQVGEHASRQLSSVELDKPTNRTGQN